MRTHKCNLCFTEILWAKTPEGRSIPFNPHPDKTYGEWHIEGDPPVCVRLVPSETEPRYSLHATICQFRTRAKRAGGK